MLGGNIKVRRYDFLGNLLPDRRKAPVELLIALYGIRIVKTENFLQLEQAISLPQLPDKPLPFLYMLPGPKDRTERDKNHFRIFVGLDVIRRQMIEQQTVGMRKKIAFSREMQRILFFLRAHINPAEPVIDKKYPLALFAFLQQELRLFVLLYLQLIGKVSYFGRTYFNKR